MDGDLQPLNLLISPDRRSVDIIDWDPVNRGGLGYRGMDLSYFSSSPG